MGKINFPHGNNYTYHPPMPNAKPIVLKRGINLIPDDILTADKTDREVTDPTTGVTRQIKAENFFKGMDVDDAEPVKIVPIIAGSTAMMKRLGDVVTMGGYNHTTGELIARAFQASTLAPADWNALSEDDRDGKIVEALLANGGVLPKEPPSVDPAADPRNQRGRRGAQADAS